MRLAMRRLWRFEAALLAALAVLLMAPFLARGATTAPDGVSAIALGGKVSLAWQPVGGAISYRVYRGTSAGSINTQVGTSATPSFTDTTVANGTGYYYAVRADDGSQGPASEPVAATPRATSCSAGNAIVRENCFPGSSSYPLQNPTRAYSGGIEGYATQDSVDQGGSIGLKVNTGEGVPYHVEIYRAGWYGGTRARLVSVLPSRSGVAQPNCQDGDGNTGLLDCSNWSVTDRITTTSDWPTGVYWLRLVREDNNTDNAVIFVVRDDGDNGNLLYQLPTNTYQAYNNYGSKSLYTFNSSGYTTVAGTARAVKVSFDRPYQQTITGQNNWFPEADQGNIAWFERQGYSIDYITSTDLQTSGSQLLNHPVFVSGAHDEYWSQQMRDATTNARDNGHSIFWLGSNQVYWKTRSESSPFSGQANRVEVCYKTTESGPADPSGQPTGTWRDPAGANAPENALVGSQYVGDNDYNDFPMVVTAAEGKNRAWRHTSLADMAPNTSQTFGTNLVGWEWNDRAANGQEPPGVSSIFSAPVNGNILQDAGRVYAQGNATGTGTYYKAASGAVVFSTSTNNWSLGLALNGFGQGEPNTFIKQATINVLTDMGVTPTTVEPGLVVDPTGAPQITNRLPAPSATGVGIDSTVRVTFDRAIDPSTLTSSTLKLTLAGNAVPASISWDDTTNTATLTPTASMDPSATYQAQVTTGVKSWSGDALASNSTWTFTTGTGSAPQITTKAPTDGANDVPVGASVTATFSRSIDPSTLTNQTFSLTGPGGPVAATLSYDGPTRTAVLAPSAPLSPATQYSATITTGVQAPDGTALSVPVTWSFTTGAAVQITSRSPAPLATSVSPSSPVRVTFSKDLDPTTVNGTSVSLTGPGGAVPASVTYDAPTRTAILTPSSQLALATSYTAHVTLGIKAADGAPLDAASDWTFTTSLTAAVGPTLVSRDPGSGATGIGRDTDVGATFDRALDPASVTSSTFVLRDAGGSPVPATVSYSGGGAINLHPTAPLAGNTTYTVDITTGLTAADGTPLAAPITWSFTTAACPCSLMTPTLTPVLTNLDVRDGRSGSGPWSYELGTKIAVTDNVQLKALAFYKDANETGTHIGRLWTASGQQLAQVTFQNETATGWQRQDLSTPVNLTPGQTYVVSVGLNSRFVMTTGGLSTQLVNGPLQSVTDGANGVYGASAGTFPTNTYQTSNYFIDAIVDYPSPAPAVSARTPIDGATGVDRSTTVTADFDRDLDPSTVNGTNVTLTGPGGPVSASVSYDGSLRRVVLTPSATLAASTTYTATLTTGIQSTGHTPLASNVTWSFTTQGPPPQVTARTPADGATGVDRSTAVTADLDRDLDPATVNGTNVTLSGPGGPVSATVTYDAGARRITLTPSATLAASTAYTATLTTGVKAVDGAALASNVTWTFTTPGPPPTVTARTPAAGATGVDVDSGVSADFDRPLDQSTVTDSTATLTGPGGAVPASVSYDPGNNRITIQPSGALSTSTTYTASLTTGIKAVDGVALGSDVTWTFTTAPCPCSLFPGDPTPPLTGLPVQDARPGDGPFGYEVGVKFTVSAPVSLRAVRFYKSAGETGSHTATLWDSSGNSLATAAFTGETASGWQRAALSSPVALTPGQTYVVSVGVNNRYSIGYGELATQVSNGPLATVADGQNGVFALSAGTFPSSSYKSSNYYVDPEVR